jgi:hypothetical protein
MLTTTATKATLNADDPGYNRFLLALQKHFDATLVLGGLRLFTTDAEGLFDLYLEHVDPSQRQHYTCNCCRRFVGTYGGLVVIADDGTQAPALWHEDVYAEANRDAIRQLAKAVRRAKVTGVFYSSVPVWGFPRTGPWTHMSVTPPETILYKKLTQTAGQLVAEKKEEGDMLLNALGTYHESDIVTAVQVLKSESLYRGEKVLGAAEWLLDLYRRRGAAKSYLHRYNLAWSAVASAPAGYCHIKSSMLGTLLTDIKAGLPFDEVKRAFDAKMHPLRYQRPTAAPAAGNIAAAEKVIERLNAAGSLARRYARLDEVVALWRPQPQLPEEPKAGGVFGHLKSNARTLGEVMDSHPLAPLMTRTMTWEKFNREVLPAAEKVELLIPPHGNFTALLTAVNPDATPILQWDIEEQRNPVSWYVYAHGSPAAQWNLSPGRWEPVTAITRNPAHWYDPTKFTHQGAFVVLLLAKAKDAQAKTASLCLFPEILKSEFHGIRSTIEAYSRSRNLDGVEQAGACGLKLDKGKPWDARAKVTANGVRTEYRLDRWD